MGKHLAIQQFFQERVTPEPTGGQNGEIRLNKSQLIKTLNIELEDLRKHILQNRRGIYKKYKCFNINDKIYE